MVHVFRKVPEKPGSGQPASLRNFRPELASSGSAPVKPGVRGSYPEKGGIFNGYMRGLDALTYHLTVNGVAPRLIAEPSTAEMRDEEPNDVAVPIPTNAFTMHDERLSPFERSPETQGRAISPKPTLTPAAHIFKDMLVPSAVNQSNAAVTAVRENTATKAVGDNADNALIPTSAGTAPKLNQCGNEQEHNRKSHGQDLEPSSTEPTVDLAFGATAEVDHSGQNAKRKRPAQEQHGTYEQKKLRSKTRTVWDVLETVTATATEEVTPADHESIEVDENVQTPMRKAVSEEQESMHATSVTQTTSHSEPDIPLANGLGGRDAGMGSTSETHTNEGSSTAVGQLDGSRAGVEAEGGAIDGASSIPVATEALVMANGVDAPASNGIDATILSVEHLQSNPEVVRKSTQVDSNSPSENPTEGKVNTTQNLRSQKRPAEDDIESELPKKQRQASTEVLIPDSAASPTPKSLALTLANNTVAATSFTTQAPQPTQEAAHAREDFESFMMTSISRLTEGQDMILRGIEDLRKEVKELKLRREGAENES
jgi:hypothetical protein